MSDSAPKPLSDALHSGLELPDVVLQTLHRLIALLLLQLQVGDNVSVRNGQAGVNALLPRLALAEFVALRRQLGLSAAQQSRVHRLQLLGLLEDLLTPRRFWLSALRDHGF